MMGNITLRDVFISTELRPHSVSINKELQLVRNRHCPVSSGFLVKIGFGDIDGIQSYIEVYDVQNFTTTTLRRRRPQNISHQLVSSGNFSVLFSAVWDANGAHVETRHTTIRAKASDILTETHVSDKWAFLYDQQTQPVQSIRDARVQLSILHEDLLQVFHAGNHVHQDRQWPQIQTTESPLEDFQGRSELVVMIVFREPDRR